ncbi:MAG TPA: SRPBCC family protein [Steroidobacteraceae bacterium]
MTRRATTCLALLCVFTAVRVQAADPAEPIDTRVEREGPLLQVTSTLGSQASALTCYETLADFDHLSEFVPGLKTSRIVSPPGAPVELHQVGEAKAGFFRVALDVTLAIQLDPPHRIEFRRLAGNLTRMEGSWSVSGDATGCRIDYRATMDPEFWVPPLIGPMLMREEVNEQMAGVLAEIARRARRTP